jgi:hypothetical protein
MITDKIRIATLLEAALSLYEKEGAGGNPSKHAVQKKKDLQTKITFFKKNDAPANNILIDICNFYKEQKSNSRFSKRMKEALYTIFELPSSANFYPNGIGAFSQNMAVAQSWAESEKKLEDAIDSYTQQQVAVRRRADAIVNAQMSSLSVDLKSIAAEYAVEPETVIRPAPRI